MRTEGYGQNVRVLAVCGSLKKTSTTRNAARIALEGARAAGASVSLADLADYELAFCTGSKAIESKGRDFPRLREEIRAALHSGTFLLAGENRVGTGTPPALGLAGISDAQASR
ncbi:MAG: NAD(P)H-dependent oxidoreductase [Fibrobacteria bacterium]